MENYIFGGLVQFFVNGRDRLKRMSLFAFVQMVVFGGSVYGTLEDERILKFEKDKVEIMRDFRLCGRISDEWFEIGEIGRALELEKLCVERGANAEILADKWFERRYVYVAQDFYKLYLKNYPREGGRIADKCYGQGDIAAAIDFDTLYVEEYEYRVREIADKWLKRGNFEAAFKFDKLVIKSCLYCASELADKWFKLGNVNFGYDFAKTASIVDPFYAIKALKQFIKRSEFALAERLANEVLAYWVAEDDEKKCANGFIWKLGLAAIIQSKHFFEQLRDKGCSKEDFNSKEYEGLEIATFYKYFKAFENIALDDGGKASSIPDFLIKRMYIDPILLENGQHGRMREAIAGSLLELSGNDIGLSIINAIGIYAMENPYFRVDIYALNIFNNSDVGYYSRHLDRVQIVRNPLTKREKFKSTLIHEWCHQLMNILYNNNCKPYAEDDHNAQKEYLEVIEALKNIKNIGNCSCKGLIKETFLIYDESEHEKELIVILPVIMASGQYDEGKAREVLRPLHDYWMKYVMADIDKFVEKRIANK